MKKVQFHCLYEEEKDFIDKSVLQSKNDPDVFGTISKNQIIHNMDEWDILGEEYSKNISFPLNQLPPKEYAHKI